MKQEPRRPEGELPVTAEVGGEGGTYTDSVVQEATREGDLPTVDSTTADPVGGIGQRAEQVSPSSDEIDDGVHAPRRSGS
jgi:hypothetical protein